MRNSDKRLNIVKISRLIVASHSEIIRTIAEKYNLSFKEADMLLILSKNPNIINAKDIVGVSKVSKAYVSKSLNLLQEKKYINIEQDEKDKRKQKIMINKKADNIIRELKEAEDKYLKKITTNLDIKKLISYYDELGKNIINMKEGN